MRVLFIVVLILYAMPPVLTLILIWSNTIQEKKHRFVKPNRGNVQNLTGIADGSAEKEE